MDLEWDLKIAIKNSEQRLINFKKLLEEVHRDKDIFPSDDKFVKWFKTFLRENKNEEQENLKRLIKEKTYENQGLNPPYCYPEYWKKE